MYRSRLLNLVTSFLSRHQHPSSGEFLLFWSHSGPVVSCLVRSRARHPLPLFIYLSFAPLTRARTRTSSPTTGPCALHPAFRTHIPCPCPPRMWKLTDGYRYIYVVVRTWSFTWFGISLSGPRPGDVDRGTYRGYLYVHIARCELEPNPTVLPPLTHASPRVLHTTYASPFFLSGPDRSGQALENHTSTAITRS